MFFAAEGGEAVYSQQKQNLELTGSDHELLIAKFRLKLNKLGKTTRPFRYDLNQIYYSFSKRLRSQPNAFVDLTASLHEMRRSTETC